MEYHCPLETPYDFETDQSEELQEVADLAAEADGDRQQLARLAMEMALEANARHLAAVQILKSIEQADAAEKTAEKQAAKEEKKEAKSATKAAKKARTIYAQFSRSWL